MTNKFIFKTTSKNYVIVWRVHIGDPTGQMMNLDFIREAKNKTSLPTPSDRHEVATWPLVPSGK
ncbi:MAG: hypothetical protein WCW35_07915 [Bacteroidota bacterium]